MTMWVWVAEAVVLALHDEQLAEHGGASGVRDRGLLQSSLARAQNLEAYVSPDVATLAAAYACGLLRNHPFIDGNKRAALVTAELFLLLNGFELVVEDAACVLIISNAASRAIDEDELAAWLREHIQKI